MRRGAPPQQLPIDPSPVPAFARVDRGPRGVRLVAAPPPETAVEPDGRPWRLDSGAPLPLRMAAMAADGLQAVGVAARADVAHSLDLRPRLRGVHDRRPPGLDRVVGVPRSNAALLHGEGGWRLVVLTSLGDVVADLGQGPVAIRGDAQVVAVSDAAGVSEHTVSTGESRAQHAGPPPAALAYAAGQLWAARGAAVTAPAAPMQSAGVPIVALVGAVDAPTIAAQHADGQISLWDTSGADPAQVARWAPPSGAPRLAGLSVGGSTVELGDPTGEQPAAALVSGLRGAVVRQIAGARSISQASHGEVALVAGDWGCATLIVDTGEHR